MSAQGDLRELAAHADQVLTVFVDHLGQVSAPVSGTDHIVVKPRHSPSVAGIGLADVGLVDLGGALLDCGRSPGRGLHPHRGVDRRQAPRREPDEIETLRGDAAGVEGRGAYNCQLARIGHAA